LPHPRIGLEQLAHGGEGATPMPSRIAMISCEEIAILQKHKWLQVQVEPRSEENYFSRGVGAKKCRWRDQKMSVEKFFPEC
jgi:hypothetical protein